LICFSVPSLALANEIWLEPSNRSANKAIGNWAAATIGGETHFAFHIPDSYDKAKEDSHAVIVLLPQNDSTFDYIVRLNVARNGQPHTTMPADTGVLNVAVTGGQLAELDISTLLPTLMPSDYVTVNLELPNNKDSTQVVGMRFQYVGIDKSVAGSSCPAGQVVTGYDANGVIQCKVDLDTRAMGSCAAGEVISAVNANGTVTCVADMHVKNTSCPAGKVLTGYAANGAPQCVALVDPLANDHNPCTNGGTNVGTRWTVSHSGLTVCDKDTGHTWEQHPLSTERNWDDSIAYCQNLGLGGGWELPELDVLETLVDTNNSDPALPTGHPFDNVQSAFYWSASTTASNPSRAWVVYFNNGDVSGSSKVNGGVHAWCVRGD
jgi:hypothetical protein